MREFCTVQFLLSQWRRLLPFVRCPRSCRSCLMKLLSTSLYYDFILLLNGRNKAHWEQVQSVPPDVFLWIYFPLSTFLFLRDVHWEFSIQLQAFLGGIYTWILLSSSIPQQFCKGIFLKVIMMREGTQLSMGIWHVSWSPRPSEVLFFSVLSCLCAPISQKWWVQLQILLKVSIRWKERSWFASVFLNTLYHFHICFSFRCEQKSDLFPCRLCRWLLLSWPVIRNHYFGASTW